MEKGLKELKQEVLGTDICTACGTCVSLCPNIISIEDRIAVLGQCDLPSGRCYRYCPRTEPSSEAEIRLFGDVNYGGEVGPYLHYCSGRSTLSAASGDFQYGGVVSALMIQAIEEGRINKAVVTKAVANFPLPITAEDRKGIVEARRSKFAMVPANKEVNRSAAIPFNQVGVVGLPCQATGSRKRQLMPREDGIAEGSVVLNIGLFCTWALSQQGWRFLLRKYVGTETIERIDIPPPPANVMEIRVAGKKRVFALDEIRGFIRPACQVCLDMTAENADLSVGMVEGRDGYNTIIVRTELGYSLLNRAVESGLIEIGPLEDERWDHLKEASLSKKRRAILEAERRGDSLPYYERLVKMKERIWKGKQTDE